MIGLPLIWLCESFEAGEFSPALCPHPRQGRGFPGPLPGGEGADTEARGEKEMAFLSGAEQEILVGLRFEKRRREWLMGRWVAKKLLASALECAPGELSIEPEEGGAPVVWRGKKPVPGCLTISHRGERALAAWTDAPNLRIGADIEQVGDANPIWMADYLTEAEWALREREGTHWPYLVWSAKEAVLKALRTGLRIDTRAIEVLPGRGATDGWRHLNLHSRVMPGKCWLGWRREGEYLLTLAMMESE